VTRFQWLTLSVLAVVLLGELFVRRRKALSLGFWLVRCLVWVAAAVAIAKPEWVQGTASFIGIGRGADVVLYLFVLAFLAASFYFYFRTVLLQRQVTQLTRHLALSEARRGLEDRATTLAPSPSEQI
jgi:hypothetical protein